MAELNARLVILQFSFSNPDVISSSVRRRGKETEEERVIRKSHSGGAMLIAPTAKCSLVEFLGELETAGYEMVAGFYKERIDANDLRGKRTYHMVRFLFARREFAEFSAEFKKMRDVIRAELRSICEGALWRVRVFDNPYFRTGEEVPGERAVSINLEAREPLFRPDGQPIAVWPKDEWGQRIGDAPIPIRVAHRLGVEDGAIRLLD